MRDESIDRTQIPDESPLPIRLSDYEYWIRHTIRNERVHADGPKGALSVSRAFRMLFPNLRNPIFAIGAPRSGTTFLGACLARLPEISYHFEPVLTKAAVRYIYNGLWSNYKARTLYRSTYAWLMRYRRKVDLRFCEKTPGNCFIIPFLNRNFHGAKFIHIVRDGRDASLSLAEKPWYRSDARLSGVRDPDGYLVGPSRRFWVEPERVDEYERTNDLHRCIWLWRRYVESALDGAAYLPPDRYMQIKYEELLKDPSEYAGRIAEFLEISSPESRKVFRDTLVGSARGDSVGRWKTELSADQARQLHREAGDLLRRLDYDV